jgi:aminomethyltransferase
MTVSDLTGPDTLPLLRYLLANNIDKAATLAGKAVYSCMLNESGGVIDDLIVYRLSDLHCRLITNAATNEKDMAWIRQQASNFNVTFDERPELALIAVQGPAARQICIDHCAAILGENSASLMRELKRFQGAFSNNDSSLFIGRTGYTGEDGFELVIPSDTANKLWEALIENGAQPCGLGARDTLRLEAGMSLYGNDLDERNSPFESGVGWSVAMDSERNFIGKSALNSSPRSKMVGLILLDRGVLRSHQAVFNAEQRVGEITSGSFSPTLQQSIALARVDAEFAAQVGDEVEIEVRNKRLKAQIAHFPFVKNGQASN